MNKKEDARPIKQIRLRQTQAHYPKEIITDNDAAQQVLEMDKYILELASSKKKTNVFLSSTGMFKVDGKLKKEYQ